MLHCHCLAGRPAFVSYHTAGACCRRIRAADTAGVVVRKRRRSERNAVFQSDHGLARRRISTACRAVNPPWFAPFASPVPAYTMPKPTRSTILRRELICGSKSRTKRPRIVLGEIAVAAARPVAFKHHRAKQTSSRGIRSSRREIRQASAAFPKVRAVVLAQSVVECEFARDLPRVLRE